MEEKKEKRIEKKSLGNSTKFFIVGLLLIISYFLINNMQGIGEAISKVNNILSPFILGFVFAFLLCPVFNKLVKTFYTAFKKKGKEPAKALSISKVIATVLTLILILVIIVGLLLLIIPEIVSTLSDMLPKVEPAFNKAAAWVANQLKKYPDLAAAIYDKLDNFSETIVNIIKDKILPQASNILAFITIGVKGTVSAIINFFIAVISCIYFLNGKEKFLAQTKKLILSLFKKENADRIFEFGDLANTQFSGFIIGKIISSIIIGFLCFIFMVILNIPYAVLISVIVGVTNVIPFFGPFIGAIPSAIILILEDPTGCLKFIIMILILQQFDGNILTPSIVGKTNKLASFWVMFAIVVGGGFFGFIGMIIGVPVFAIIYTYIARFIDNNLRKKELATDTFSYENYEKFDGDNVEIKKSKRELAKEKEKKETKEITDKLKKIFLKDKNDK